MGENNPAIGNTAPYQRLIDAFGQSPGEFLGPALQAAGGIKEAISEITNFAEDSKQLHDLVATVNAQYYRLETAIVPTLGRVTKCAEVVADTLPGVVDWVEAGMLERAKEYIGILIKEVNALHNLLEKVEDEYKALMDILIEAELKVATRIADLDNKRVVKLAIGIPSLLGGVAVAVGVTAIVLTAGAATPAVVALASTAGGAGLGTTVAGSVVLLGLPALKKVQKALKKLEGPIVDLKSTITLQRAQYQEILISCESAQKDTGEVEKKIEYGEQDMAKLGKLHAVTMKHLKESVAKATTSWKNLQVTSDAAYKKALQQQKQWPNDGGH